MQRKAAEDLRKLVTDALVEAGLVYEGAKAFATPRRLALTVHGLPARSPDRREEQKGPRVGAPEKAIEGFLKSAGLASIDQAKVQAGQEGRFLRRRRSRSPAGRRRRSSPRSCRRSSAPSPGRSRCAGAQRSAKPGSLDLGPPAPFDPLHLRPGDRGTEVVDFEVDGIRSGNVTYGHRFMAPAPIAVRRFDDYVAEAGEGEGRPRRRPPQGDHPRRRPRPRVRARPRTGRGRGAARGGRRAGRMAGGADRRVRRGLPRHPAGGHPRHHPRQPEVLRAARDAEARAASSPTASSSSPTSRRATAARRSSPATSASSAPASPTRAISGRPT